jgi:hypothetical protein
MYKGYWEYCAVILWGWSVLGVCLYQFLIHFLFSFLNGISSYFQSSQYDPK